jgi:hypothetical protein
MKPTEIKFVAVHGGVHKAVTKLFFDHETFSPTAVRLVGEDVTIPIDHVKLVVVTGKKNVNSLHLWEEESVKVPAHVEKPEVKKAAKK